ncbi:hypothetical protein [Flammeovirga sp. SJP92]|uniref:hypothetical protein n=1 Tax=Flammeovirga sp. SJP92 TaxID=1775430 RepID=UPI00078815F9|nr:hypothetical protein [Flammeovirga sp. SJP92]KXX71228.1 hypothetical protein AVL50_09230 [Flammeovirga sp. SJP92]
MKKYLSIIIFCVLPSLLFAQIKPSNSASFDLEGNGNWFLVGTKGGRHASFTYNYSHSTSHNPSISKGTIQFINSQGHTIQTHQTMGYSSHNQLQFAYINKGGTSEIWVKATDGVNTGVFTIIDSHFFSTDLLGQQQDNNLSDNGGKLLIYDKLIDHAHIYHGRAQFHDKVAINTSKYDDYQLSVGGKIRAEEVKVYTDWADYVFEENYDLRPLSDVEKHIQENGHLPDVPSAKQVKEEGINLGESDAMLLRKIEELTLYIIDQDKTNKLLKEELDQLKKEIKDIKN